MRSLIHAIRRFGASEDGAALAEYGLLVALIAAICIISIKTIGGTVSTAFKTVDTNLP
ncbi:MAG: Flp family type IVb pilin [Gemmatimonadota bacterium]